MSKKIITLLIMCFALTLSTFASPESEVKSVLKQHNKALKNHDVKTIKSLYTQDYMSSDGFDLEKTTEMLEKTYKAYKNLTYNTKINSVTAYENWAVAQLSDKTKAKVYPYENRKYRKKAGYLKGKSAYNVYLKKDNGKWKIAYDDILAEETSLTYGVANNIDMELITPMSVKNEEDYNVSLKINKPDTIIAIGSLSTEEITYPIPDYNEKFRKIPPSGDLERLVKANNKNLDEYAIASVGFTKISVNEEETKAKIEVIGMAYLMKRINMENKKKFLVENKK